MGSRGALFKRRALPWKVELLIMAPLLPAMFCRFSSHSVKELLLIPKRLATHTASIQAVRAVSAVDTRVVAPLVPKNGQV